jgi:ABC-type multidrug transport system fused ATPase/permease subunit
VLRPYFVRHWPTLAGAAFFSVLLTVSELAKPFPLKLVVDKLFAEYDGAFALDRGQLLLIAGIAGLVVGIALLDAASSYFVDLSLKRAGEHISHDLRVAAYGQLQRLSLSYHAKRPKGDLVTRVTGDVTAVGDLFSDTLGTMAQALLLLIGMLVVTLMLDPVLALAAFALVPILFLITFYSRRRIKAIARRQRNQEGEIASLAAEALSAMPVVKAFGSERFEHERVSRWSEARRETGIEAARIESRFGGAIDVVAAVGTAGVIALGAFRVAAGALTPGDLVVFASYSRRLYRPLRDIARQANRASKAMARAERIADLLATDRELDDRGGSLRFGQASGEVELRDVSFAYDPSRPALAGLSVRIPAGSRVAIMGPSGAGKSTLAALIARFYDPVAGAVLVDGRDACEYDLRWLRSQVGMVLQETVLFSGTVAENIAYGTDAEADDIIAASKAAAADEFIRRLPDGYDTALGPSGVGLSGGQRQRIGIARTLLRDPTILVLDEPTTGLDQESEAQVLDGLAALMEGRTTIVITHASRLAATADRVVVLEDGKVVEEGAPAELIDSVGGGFTRPSLGHLRSVASAARGALARRRVVRQSPRRRASRRPPAPRDPALPQIAALLDGAAMAPVLERSLGHRRSVERVRPVYLRYKPGRQLVVHYQALANAASHDVVAMVAPGADLRRKVRKPENLELVRAVEGRSPAADPLSYDSELDALIQWLPLDLSLPALAEPGPRLFRRLVQAGVHGATLAACAAALRSAHAERVSGMTFARTVGRCELRSPHEPIRLAYKPRRHALLRLNGYVLKTYAKQAHFEAVTDRLFLSSGVEGVLVPRLVGTVPELRATVQTAIEGSPPANPASVAPALGAALRALHDSRVEGLPVNTSGDRLAAAAAGARLIESIAPWLGPRLDALLRRLEDALPRDGPLGPAHGDLTPLNLLVQGADVALVDLDRLCAAAPALDFGTYAARVLLGRPGDLESAHELLDALVEGYGRRPDGLSWYLASAILCQAQFPFRHVQADWPELVEALVGDAERAVQAASPLPWR